MTQWRTDIDAIPEGAEFDVVVEKHNGAKWREPDCVIVGGVIKAYDDDIGFEPIEFDYRPRVNEWQKITHWCEVTLP